MPCGVANALWSAFFSRFGLCWVMSGSVRELFACWWTGGRLRSAMVWKMVPLCLMWCIGMIVMLDALKARRGLLRKFSITSFLLFILGLRAGLPACY
jgi:hypothetical protein